MPHIIHNNIDPRSSLDAFVRLFGHALKVIAVGDNNNNNKKNALVWTYNIKTFRFKCKYELFFFFF